jgi:hypothetical protein
MIVLSARCVPYFQRQLTARGISLSAVLRKQRGNSRGNARNSGILREAGGGFVYRVGVAALFIVCCAGARAGSLRYER